MTCEASKFTMIDLFAGCGGLSLGMEQAGFAPVLFSELNLNAAETLMDIPSNQLYPKMAWVIRALRPKIFSFD